MASRWSLSAGLFFFWYMTSPRIHSALAFGAELNQAPAAKTTNLDGLWVFAPGYLPIKRCRIERLVTAPKPAGLADIDELVGVWGV
jgi:hypothetical protein